MENEGRVIELNGSKIGDRASSMREVVVEEFFENPDVVQITVYFAHRYVAGGDMVVTERVFTRVADDWVEENVTAFVPDWNRRTVGIESSWQEAYLANAGELIEWREEFNLYAA